ncbi:MAG: hypothetical protein Q7S88_02550 [Candidatus Daviesbacteria bacterium]|nr:hypothetical protein [Candidatus Daviesbacteria bacterium]
MSAEVSLVTAPNPNKFGSCRGCAFFERRRDGELIHQVVGFGWCKKWRIETNTVIGPTTALENAVMKKQVEDLLMYRQTCFEEMLNPPQSPTLSKRGSGKIPVNHFTMQTGLSFRQLNKHTR